MNEPDWNEIGNKYVRLPRKDDIVWVTKKTRGRFPDTMGIAVPGDFGIVISQWTSSMGSVKLCVLTHDQREVGTTATCIRIFSTLADARENEKGDEWMPVKLAWMERTYVPIVVMREFKTRRHQREDPYVTSRDGRSALVVPLNSKEKMWVNRDKVYPGDWERMIASDKRCHSLRVPLWIAKKSGVFGKID